MTVNTKQIDMDTNVCVLQTRRNLYNRVSTPEEREIGQNLKNIADKYDYFRKTVYFSDFCRAWQMVFCNYGYNSWRRLRRFIWSYYR